MQVRKVPAQQSWHWVVQGWQLFLRAPGLWIVLVLIYFAIGFVLSFIPLVGPLASVLITPALIGGMLYGAATLAKGGELTVGHLFAALQNQALLGPTLTLGAFLLAGYVITALVGATFMAGIFFQSGAMSEVHQPMMHQQLPVATLVFAIGTVLVLSLLMAMAMIYAVPLVTLNHEKPWPSIQNSVRACFKNLPALLLFALIYLGLAVLAALPFGLGFLVLAPVTFGAIYYSYQDLFLTSS